MSSALLTVFEQEITKRVLIESSTLMGATFMQTLNYRSAK